MTREEMKDVAEQAAEEAVKRMLLTLGINTSTDDSIVAFQKDAAFTRSLRESSEAVKRKTILTIVGIFVTGMAGYLLLTFKSP